MMSRNEKTAVEFVLSEGQKHDAPYGRLLMEIVGKLKHVIPIVMDRAYEDNITRYIAQTLNFKPVVPPNKNRVHPWEYNVTSYKRRNEIERFFRLIKGFRRIFTRFEKLDIMFIGFVQFALVCMTIR
jgi:transposase